MPLVIAMASITLRSHQETYFNDFRETYLNPGLEQELGEVPEAEYNLENLDGDYTLEIVTDDFTDAEEVAEAIQDLLEDDVKAVSKMNDYAYVTIDGEKLGDAIMKHIS